MAALIRIYKLLLFIAVLLLCSWRAQGQASSCTTDSQCGEFATCNGTCRCNSDALSATGLNTDCFSRTEPNPSCVQYDAQCVFCGGTNQGPCLRCIEGSFLSSTTCVGFCSAGFQIVAIPGTSGLVARECNDLPNTSDSLPQWAIIVIAVVAVVLFIGIVIIILIFALSILTKSTHGQFDVVDPEQRRGTESSENNNTLRTKRSNSFQFENKTSPDGYPMIQHNPNFADDIKGDDETVFFHKLDYLRTQSEVFLKMLNDMRRRLKEIPVDSTAAQQYRNVMQDVTRLLYLLNKKRSSVAMPPDGMQLMMWSEQILERYLTSQGVTLTRGDTKTNRLSTLGPQDETAF